MPAQGAPAGSGEGGSSSGKAAAQQPGTSGPTQGGGNASAAASSSAAGGASNGAASSAAGTTTQRSRTACINCRATKQKCDGPSRIPCRRCELYNLECQYTDVPPRQAVKRKIEDTDGNISTPQVPRPAAIVPTDVAGTILQKLEELSERQKSVEDVLRYQAQSRPTALPGMGELGLPDTLSTASNMRGGNPVSAVAESFRSMEDPNAQSLGANGINMFPGSMLASGMDAGTPTPDAITRGLITIEQAQRYFAFFVEHCRYWVHGFVPSQINDCMRVRQTSPLLFGAIICVSSYFLDAVNGESGLQLYLSLVALTNETLAPIIMSPDNAELNDEFILGIAICIIWKAPRIDSRRLGFADFPRMQHLAKLNNSTTYFLSGIAGRAARVNRLDRSPAVLVGGDVSSAAMARARLWLWMCFVDAHGCMQNGRAASIDITDSLKLTRTFASLNDHPTDVELCALLEVSSVYRTFHGTSEDDRTNLPALAQANADLDAITNFWYQHYPRLLYEGAFVVQFIAPFHRLVINADVYRSWAVRDLAAREKGATDQATLSHEEAKYLTIGVEAAQTLLLFLSMNARADNGRRIPRFEDPQYWKDGLPIYKPMEPDPDHARHIRTAVDTVVTVIITFSAMFLAKLRAANLMRCDLTVVTPANPIKDYETDYRGQIALYSKFFRIIELASDFLEMVAPNPGHPCTTQSRVLRSLLSAATNRIQPYNTNPTSSSVQNLANVSKAGMQGVMSSAHNPQIAQHHNALPRYAHSVIGQATVDHSANSPVASGQDWSAQLPTILAPNQGVQDASLNDMLAGVGQPGPGLVSSFLGGDEWSMLMNSLGLQQQ